MDRERFVVMLRHGEEIMGKTIRSRQGWFLPLLLAGLLLLGGCAGDPKPAKTAASATEQEGGSGQEGSAETIDFRDLSPTGEMALSYADQFSVTEYGDYRLLSITDIGDYLLVPKDRPRNVPDDIAVLQQPLTHIYLAATSAMDFFCKLDRVDAIRFSALRASGWYSDKAREAMEEGAILYAGKYSAPDYELLLEESCDVAIESTMILHNPKVREQLTRVGIPVIVEHSSYESHPLGRMEWIRFYGVLLGREAEADAFFAEQRDAFEKIAEQEPTGKKVAFFSIDSKQTVGIRKSDDYIARLIGLAGGTYVPSDAAGEENALSTTKLQMEAFYEAVKDADCLIYNSTIEGELPDLSSLLAKSPLLADVRAVRTGQVFCVPQNLFQETTAIGDLLVDVHKVLTDEAVGDEELSYLYRLR